MTVTHYTGLKDQLIDVGRPYHQDRWNNMARWHKWHKTKEGKKKTFFEDGILGYKSSVEQH